MIIQKISSFGCIFPGLICANLAFGGPCSDTSRLTLVFAGDIMGHDAQISAAWYSDSGKYDYNFCFSALKPFIRDADIAIGNLEVTLAGEPYKGYPQFSSPDELADALKESGFDILVNANNHALDRGKNGLERTLDITGRKGLIMSGTYKSVEDRETRYPLIIEKNNILLAILNYTYGTNGLVTSPPNIVNYIDTSIILTDIQKARKVNPDFIIACIHWGNEYEREPDETQRAIARFLFDRGVNAIIGSHPHVIQPAEIQYNGRDSSDLRLVVYSVGNFISNQRERYRDGGIMIHMELTKIRETAITDYSYLPVWVHKPIINGITRFRLIPANLPAGEINQLKLTGEEQDKLNQFKKDTRIHLQKVRMSKLENIY